MVTNISSSSIKLDSGVNVTWLGRVFRDVYAPEASLPTHTCSSSLSVGRVEPLEGEMVFFEGEGEMSVSLFYMAESFVFLLLNLTQDVLAYLHRKQ